MNTFEKDTNIPKAATPWRTFSIFISSTFADFQAERDYLKQIVFPGVDEELQKRRIKLKIVNFADVCKVGNEYIE